MQTKYKTAKNTDFILSDIKRLHCNTGVIYNNVFYPILKHFRRSVSTVMMINTARIICYRIGILKQYDDAADGNASNYALTIPRDILQELENVCFTSSYQEKYNESKQIALRGTNQQAPSFENPLETTTNILAE